MKIKASSILLILTLLAFVFAWSVSPVVAQTPTAPAYAMGLSRTFGYGAGSQIRGTFTAHIAGPEGIAKVTYFIDGQVLATVTASPFRYQFNTSSYPTGNHSLYAEVTTTSGSVVTTQTLTYDFVSQADQGQSMTKIVLPLFGAIVGLMLLVVLGTTLSFRRRKGAGIPPGTERSYGIAGGSICPHCHRPTPRHMWGMNVGFGKFDYCENCGKWSVMRALPLETLRAAEQAEKASAQNGSSTPVKEKTEEEKLREMIEKSKYDNQ